LLFGLLIVEGLLIFLKDYYYIALKTSQLKDYSPHRLYGSAEEPRQRSSILSLITSTHHESTHYYSKWLLQAKKNVNIVIF
jgi:hypothetical protein